MYWRIPAVMETQRSEERGKWMFHTRTVIHCVITVI